MFSKKVPLFTVVLLIAASTTATYFTTKELSGKKVEVDTSLLTCTNSKIRLGGFKYIRPLLLTESTCESDILMPVKSELMKMIQDFKLSGSLQQASVYLRELNEGQWISVERNEKYFPGSLMKVPELITFIKMNEKSPGLLDKQVQFTAPAITRKNANIVSKSLELGKTYTVRQLLYYMIVYSDNEATVLLNRMMDLTVFSKTFTDLGLQAPNLRSSDIPISAEEFSHFMRAIYNATYMSMDDSEYCAGLLAKAEYSSGMRSGLPEKIALAHKFGEAGDSNAAHFSESGIIYINNNAYMLTIMTKGKALNTLPGVVRDLTGKVYSMLAS
jgi:beta-lactamase class A